MSQVTTRRAQSHLAWVSAFLAVSAIIGYFVGMTETYLVEERLNVWLSIIFVGILSLVGIRWLRVSQEIDVFEPMALVCLGYLLYFVLVPLLYSIRPDEAVLTFFPDAIRNLNRVEPLLAVTLAAFILGYRIKVFNRGNNSSSSILGLDCGLTHRFRIGLTSLVIVGSVSYIVYFHSVGGLKFMLANSSRRATWLSDLGLVGLGWSFWASQFLLPVPVLTYAYMLKTGRRRYAWLAWILGMAITLLFLPLGGRLRALTPLILVFIARHYLEDRVTVRQVILLSGVLIMFIFVAGVIRGQNLGSRVLSNPLMTLQDISYSLVRVLGLDFDRIEVLAFIMDWFPGRMPLLQGRTFVSTFMPILTKIIPNLSYNSFPSAGIFLGQIIYGRSDIPGGPLPTLLGEIYMNFGYWGSVFGFFLVGAILRLLYTVFKPSLGRDVGLSVLYSMLTFLLVFNSFFNNLALFKASIIILPTTLIVLEFGSRRFTSRRAKV